jgi:hypothetical protein
MISFASCGQALGASISFSQVTVVGYTSCDRQPGTLRLQQLAISQTGWRAW